MELPCCDRYDSYCTRFGCFPNVRKDDFENPWPSLAYGGVTFYPDPRIPSQIRDALCGPAGCAAPLPQLPGGVLMSQGCIPCEETKQWS